MIIGTTQRNNYFGSIASKILVALCLFFLAVNGWGACTQTIQNINANGKCYTFVEQGSGDGSCSDGSGGCGIRYRLNSNGTISQMRQCVNAGNSNYFWYRDCPSSLGGVTPEGLCGINPGLAGCKSPQQECEEQGLAWVDNACVDPTQCDSYRAACEKNGGKFTGSLNPEGCIATCNTCNSVYYNRQRNKFINACCGAGYAPPDELDTAVCQTQLASGPGMNYSDPLTCGGGYACECNDPEESSSMFNDYCVGGNRYDENPGDDSDDVPPESLYVPRDIGEGDWEYNYYPILDTIRDTLVKRIAPALEQIAACLTTGTCVGGGDTVIVNVDGAGGGFDTALVRSIKSSIDSMRIENGRGQDTLIDSLRKYNHNSEAYVGNAVDTLTDSIRKYIADGANKTKRATDSLHGTISEFINGVPAGADTSSYRTYGDAWFTEGDRLADSIKGENGLSDIDFAADSAWIDSLVMQGYTCVADSCCLDGNTFCIHWDSDSVVVDSLRRLQTTLYDSLVKVNQEYKEDSLAPLVQEIYDSVKAVNPFGVFDSTIMQTLGVNIPNTNTCPEHCSSWNVDVPFFFGILPINFDYGLCMSRSVFAGGNVLSFVRFILRIIVAFTCISIVMWAVAGYKTRL